jgi:hypothetical protein
MTTFYRLLKDTDKADALRSAVAAHRSGDTDPERTFTVDPTAFFKVPNTPFAYWVDDEIRDLFVKLPPFESEGRTVKQGLATADDFRFVRAWWEVDPARRLDPGLAGAPDWREDLEGFQSWCRRRTHQGKGWAPFAKGGEYSPYYSDIHLVVNWEREGEEIKNFVDPKTGKQNSRPQNTDYYFRPGVTWPLRAKRFNPSPMAAGSVFSVRGYSFFVPPQESGYWLSWANSEMTDLLFKVMLGRSDYPEFIVGILSQLPVPTEPEVGSDHYDGIINLVDRRRSDFAQDEDSLLFSGLDTARPSSDSDNVELRSYETEYGFRPGQVDEVFLAMGSDRDDLLHSSFAPISLETVVGAAFARWDLRLARNPDLVPALPDPFDPLPVVPPATLIGPDGLPATSGSIVSEEWLRARPNAITLPPAGSIASPTISDDEYPIPIPWDGILVDDPDHPADIVGRIRQVLTVLHGERAQQAEDELCSELKVDTLREYIANPKGFFADHLSRYSKSRRKAPIYWPLSTPSGGWTAWIYYPRLTDSTIYTLIEHYVHKRLELARDLYNAVAPIPAASRSPGQQRQFDLSSRDQDELATMEEELKQIAAMPYRVNHDDGVPILAAPFAGMFRHREWAKYLAGIWEKLEAGDYDWAHLAYAIWPERVREKARDDRSIAIAHGIEETT